MADIASWLTDVGLGEYAALFREHRLDTDVLPDLIESDLEKLGMPLGDRKRLLKAIAGLRAAPADLVEPAAADGPVSEAERRHLTVLFCDMVGSTELAARLDPEDVCDLVRAFQKACEAEIRRFDGFVARYMGDGLLAYFGYPVAHEDDAERAVRAGLGIVGAVRDLGRSLGGVRHVELAVRVGLATGRVVAGDLVGEGLAEERTVVGQTPNLAARLQAMAKPGTVVAGPDTRRIVGDLFEWEDLGPQSLKGFPEPVRAWRVVQAKQAETRFEARHGAALTPLVGREEEIDLLLRRWRSAKGGDGQVVLVSGEPGVGKSRIAQTLRDRVADEPQVRVRYQCAPFFTKTAFHPFVEQLSRAAGFARSDAPDRRLDKMEAMLRLAVDDVGAVAPLFAALLSIPSGARYPAPDLAPEQWKERTIEAILRQMEGLAAHQPMLVIFEDAHWIDPTSLELLDRAIERAQSLPILFVITFRPEFAAPWVGQPHVALLSLSRMGRRECAALVARVAGEPLPAGVVDQIIERSDGVPLFVEELTKAVVDAGPVREPTGARAAAGPLPAFAIPASLQDSLMARLDRMAAVKEVAQVGAAIGREFPYELIAAVGPMAEDALRDALAQLAEAKLVFQRGTPPEATYVFKHALVRDAAYESLLRSKRQALHLRIAEALERRFPDIVETEPETLARHFTEAGSAERAIPYWLLAGRRASARSANVEAIAQLERGLDLVRSLPGTPERARLELPLQLDLGPALIIVRSPPSRAVERAFATARSLSERVGDTAQRFAALWGLWQVYEHRADWQTARALADELMAVADSQSDDALRLQAHHAQWSSSFFSGHLTAAENHAARGVLLYDRQAHRSHAFRYGGHDPGACAHSIRACALVLLGFPVRALASEAGAFRVAEDLAHPASLAQAHLLAAFVRHALGDAAATRRHADAVLTISVEHGVSQYLLMARLLQGWARAEQGEAEAAASALSDVLAPLRAARRPMMLMPFYLCVLAEVCLRAGTIDAGRDALRDASELIARQDEHLWEAEALRLEGRLLLAGRVPDETAAADVLTRAVNVARRQESKWLELRAATSLAELRAGQGRRAEARETLEPVYGWFTEGLDLPGLAAAAAALEALRA